MTLVRVSEKWDVAIMVLYIKRMTDMKRRA
jgi:hypothetical protein